MRACVCTVLRLCLRAFSLCVLGATLIVWMGGRVCKPLASAPSLPSQDRLTFRVFVHDGGSLVADRGMLEAHALRLQQHVSPLVAGHIWQHDAPHFAAQVRRLCTCVPVPVMPVPALR